MNVRDGALPHDADAGSTADLIEDEARESGVERPSGRALRRLLGGNGKRGLRAHHEIRLLKGGEQYFPALVAAIDAARSEILFETYIFEFARSVIPVAEAFEAAARRGVVVRIVVDGIGTGPIPPEWEARWKAAGVHWRVFNPASGWRVVVPKRWRRLHRKLCVVDARIAFCGGINLLDDFFDPNHGALDQPRFDFAVRVTGPLVTDIHETTTRLWARLQVGREVGRHDVAGVVEAVVGAVEAGTDAAEEAVDANVAPPPTASPGQGALAALVLRDNVRFRRSIEGNYRIAIALARREILIANAYFIPGLKLQRALLRAARRGVKVTLLLQGRYEYFMQYHASRAVYGTLLAAGIEIIEYEASFLHAKVAVMDSEDGAVATVGSSNLDPLSLLLAREANVFVRDDAFAAELRSHLLQAIEKGRRVAAETHAQWPIVARTRNWIAYAAVRAALFLTGTRYL